MHGDYTALIAETFHVGSGDIHILCIIVIHLSSRLLSKTRIPVDVSSHTQLRDQADRMSCVQWRYVLAVFLFLGFILHDCFRSSLSITIVCMVDHGGGKIENNTYSIDTNGSALYNTKHQENATINITDATGLPRDTCYEQEAEIEERDAVRGEFRWSKQIQGLLLGAVFWGYMALQAPTGWLAEKFGAHRIILVFFTIASISCLCTPVAAHAHPYVLLAVRIVTGMGIAVIYPSLPVLWSRWAPPSEWGRLMSVSLSGGLLGNAVIFPVGGYMCEHGFAGGWPSLYYLLGAIGLVWCLAWAVIVRDSPAASPWMALVDATPWISDSEKSFLQESTKTRLVTQRRPSIAWRRMMTSPATIAVIATHSLINYGTYMLITQLPTYMKEVMGFNIHANGLYSMVPFLAFFIVAFSVGFMSDFLTSHCRLGIGATRKILNTLGCLLPAGSLLILALVQCMSHSVAIALLCGAVGFVGMCYGGCVVNYADIALHYAGTLSGISNSIGTVPGIVAPYIVAVITVNGTRQEWQYAFYTGVAGYALATVIFLCFSSGDVQPWARPDSTMVVLRDSPSTSPDEKKQIHNGDIIV